MKPIRMYLDRIAFWGPGIEDWEALRSMLDGVGYLPSDDWQVSPMCLSPRSALRVSPQIRLAVAIAERIAPSLREDAGWVFASSVGEGETLQVMLEALRKPDMTIQPLRFQNAVHNAASGHWSIAASLTGPITSVAAHDETVGAGFLKACIQLTIEERSIGLVLYDVPMPEPLNAKRPLGLPIGAGFALSPHSGPSTMVAIDVSIADEPLTKPECEVSRVLAASGNPVAQVLPLIERIIRGTEGNVFIGLHGGAALCLNVTSI
jgi:hypothetical protein